MTGLNKYYKRSHISETKFRQIIKLFCHDLPASKVAEITGVSRVTINKLFLKLRIRIAQLCEQASPLSGEVEVDESYFGAKRVRGKRGRGASGKTIVFGILKRDGNVYTEIVPDASKKQLQQVIRGKVDIGSVIHSDGWRGYNGLVDVGYEKHYRVHHGKNAFARGNAHINGIASDKLHLHLKECEFRFNHRHDNLYAKLLSRVLILRHYENR